MNFKSKIEKLEQKFNLANKSNFMKYRIVQYFTDAGDDAEIKKQKAIEERINQMANELNISHNKASELFKTLDIELMHIKFV